MSDITTSKPKGLQPYIIQEWVNGENTNTPISAERLTHMEVGIGDLSKTLLDGREPAYTVTSETAPVPSTPCTLVVIDDTGLYQGTWRDDGKTRTQVGWGPAGDQELYSFTPTKNGHAHDWATLTRHGVMVDLTGHYTPEDKEKDVAYPVYLDWAKIPLSCIPPHAIYSKDVTLISTDTSIDVSRNEWVPHLLVDPQLGGAIPLIKGIAKNTADLYFHAVWMTDAAPLPASVLKSAMPEATPTVQAPAEQASTSQAMPAQEQAPAVQPDVSQAPAQQEQAAAQSPATQAVQEQAPARTSPAHAATGQTPAVQAPAAQDAPVQAAGTARHARQGLEE